MRNKRLVVAMMGISVGLLNLAGVARGADAPAVVAQKTVEVPKDAKSEKSKDQLPPNVVAHKDIVFDTVGDRKLKLDLYVPKGDGPFVGVVVVHGGGWTGGDKEKFTPIAQQLAARGFAAATIEYRLAGDAKFPALIQDCNSATRWMRAEAGTYHIDPKRIAAVGGSAGGHLVGLMATASKVKMMQGSGAHLDQSSEVQAAIIMGGPMDLAGRAAASPEVAKKLNPMLGGTYDQMKQGYIDASPITYVSRETPPLLFLEGELDTARQGYVSFLSKLDAAGVSHKLVVFTNGKHGCWNLDPWAPFMLDDMAAFLKDKLPAK